MDSNKLIVREYLASLKEDAELDYLFPILLSVMGFRIVQTAKEAKGQSQYGKDIIAIGKDKSGIKYRWYFELKGYSDRDITDANYSKSDGIRESIIEAKDTVFKDSAIPELNSLPVKIVLVHNGILKTNIRPTFEGLIAREFKENEFERWDIYYLTDLFGEYLFSEYLLSDDRSNILLKRSLTFLDSPDNDYEIFKELVVLQFDKVTDIKSRSFVKLFATLGLLNSIVFHYSKENEYLVPAKECSKILVLYTWHWILKNKLETKKAVLNEFNKILIGQYEIFSSYFKKTFHVARIPGGLFADNGHFYEKIGYPLRCLEYLDDIIYCARLRLVIVGEKNSVKVKNKIKDLIIELVNNNSGFSRPLLDNHSIPIIQLLLFFNDKTCLRKKDIDFLFNYLHNIILNLQIGKIRHKIQPELHNNIELVIEAIATGIKPKEYCDSSSILIAILLELCAVFESKELFEQILSFIDKNLSLQIASIDFNEYDVETLLFEKNLHQEYYVECIERVKGGMTFLKEDADFEDFKRTVAEKKDVVNEFRTDKVGLDFIRYLAHSFFKNEILPNEWRQFI